MFFQYFKMKISREKFHTHIPSTTQYFYRGSLCILDDFVCFRRRIQLIKIVEKKKNLDRGVAGNLFVGVSDKKKKKQCNILRRGLNNLPSMHAPEFLRPLNYISFVSYIRSKASRYLTPILLVIAYCGSICTDQFYLIGLNLYRFINDRTNSRIVINNC